MITQDEIQEIEDKYNSSVDYYNEYSSNLPWKFQVCRGENTPLKIVVYEIDSDAVWAECDTEEQAVKIRDALNQNKLLRYLSHVALPKLLNEVNKDE